MPVYRLSFLVHQNGLKKNAIGITVKKGRYGGTYAHKDIAFEFGSAISVPFKLYLIEEFQRLKEEEQIGYMLLPTSNNKRYKTSFPLIRTIFEPEGASPSPIYSLKGDVFRAVWPILLVISELIIIFVKN